VHVCMYVYVYAHVNVSVYVCTILPRPYPMSSVVRCNPSLPFPSPPHNISAGMCRPSARRRLFRSFTTAGCVVVHHEAGVPGRRVVCGCSGGKSLIATSLSVLSLIAEGRGKRRKGKRKYVSWRFVVWRRCGRGQVWYACREWSSGCAKAGQITG